MKLFVQIPCLNEEQTLPEVLKTIPKKVEGFNSVEILIIDDGSTDKTIAVAKKYGVKHFVIHDQNMGLARSFHDGVNYCLENGADVVINTDGDNQYPQAQIADLVKPILGGKAEIVIGDRQTAKISHFSGFKKLMQRFGSWVVNKAAGTELPDAASGFRAYTREALYRINIVTSFSYCMETIIQAGNKRIPIVSVPITTNPKTRESRLFKNIWQHMFKSGSAIVRSYIMYRPHLIFLSSAAVFFLLGAIPFVRYAIIYFGGNHGGDHIQSLLLGSVAFFVAIISVALSIISDMIRTNRTLQEDTLERIKRIEFKN